MVSVLGSFQTKQLNSACINFDKNRPCNNLRVFRFDDAYNFYHFLFNWVVKCSHGCSLEYLVLIVHNLCIGSDGGPNKYHSYVTFQMCFNGTKMQLVVRSNPFYNYNIYIIYTNYVCCVSLFTYQIIWVHICY